MARRVPERLPALLITLVLLVSGLTVGPSVAQAVCHPILTEPAFTGAVPRSEEGLRRALGEAHRRYTRLINFREGWRGHLW